MVQWPEVWSWGLEANEMSNRFGAILLLTGTAVLVFANWYMTSDPHLKFFLNSLMIFIMGMNILIFSSNLITLILGWEAIGITSFILIGFYSTRLEALKASLKAVITNKVGDVALICGIIIISLNLSSDIEIIRISEQVAIFEASLLLIALMAKSAQIGLHVWY
jgi:NADH:ubiquinone oxidoreductase subunit 5 (subunit L)/multisubunit Na+/H+ antiporter MnhA subunit